MNHPDEDLPELQISLTQFVAIAGQLFADGQNSDAFVRFVLAGRLQSHRIFVNARQETSAPPLGQYQLRRDIDSVIGITNDLPFRATLAIFPVPSFRDTLTKDVHVKYTGNLSSAKVGSYIVFCVKKL